MQNHRIGPVQELARRVFEIRRRRIKHREIQVRTHELQNAVRLDDHILRAFQTLTKRWHCFGEAALLSADPKYFCGPGYQKTGRIRFSATIALFCNRP